MEGEYIRDWIIRKEIACGKEGGKLGGWIRCRIEKWIEKD